MPRRVPVRRAAFGALALGGALLAPLAPAHEKAPAVTGVVGLDLYGSGRTVDAVLAVQDAGARVELRHVRSADGGRTWSAARPILPGRARVFPPRRGADPQIASSGESLVVVWTEPGSSPWGSGRLASALSADGGKTWTPGPNPSDDGSDQDHGFVDVAATSPGRFLAVWLDGRGGTQGLRSAVSADGGRSWGKNVTIQAKTCECCANRLLVTPDAVRVIYRQLSPRDMAVATTKDGGATWEALGTAARFGWSFDGCPEVGGALAASTKNGRPRLQALVWTGKESSAGVWTVASDDGGATWSKAKRLGDGTARQLDMAGNGACVTAAWDEYRGSAKRHAVVAASSCDGGSTWSKPAVLSDAGASASYPLVATTSEGAAVAWTERVGAAPVRWAARVVPPPDAAPR